MRVDRPTPVTREPPVRRLLVITYHYPPDGAVGGMRWAGFSKYLVRLGWEVHIITASPESVDTSIPGVFPVHRRPKRTLNDFYNLIAQRYKSAPPERPLGASMPVAPRDRPPSFLRNTAQALRRIGATWLMVPDYGRGWVIRAGRAARAELRAREFHAVVTSGPPHSVHLSGVIATMGRPETFWIDMRDPWAAIVGQPSLDAYRSATMRFLVPRLERFVFRRARKVIANTAEFAASLRAMEPNMSVAFIPNGIDLEQLPERDSTRFDGCSIAYLGTMYAGRSLASVLSAMSEMVRDRPELATTLKLRIAGQMHAAHRDRLKLDLANAGIADSVIHYGVVPRVEALALLNQSHLALVLAQDQPTQVPAKLYECIGLGVPTLVIAESSSAAAREGRRIGALVVEPADIAGIRAVFQSAVDGHLPAKVTASSTISYEDLAMDMERVLLTGHEWKDRKTPRSMQVQAAPQPGPARAG